MKRLVPSRPRRHGAGRCRLPGRRRDRAGASRRHASDTGPVTVTSTVTSPQGRERERPGRRHADRARWMSTRPPTCRVARRSTSRGPGRTRPAASWPTRTRSTPQQEEYPFVLLECRGIDSTSVARREQLSPETCWTQTWSERYQDSLGRHLPAVPAGPVRPVRRTGPVVGAPSPAARRRATCEPAPIAALGAVRRRETARSTTAGMPAAPESRPSRRTSAGRALPSNETFGVTGSRR